MSTIADELDGTDAIEAEILHKYIFDHNTAEYTFEDGSRAIILTILDKVQPYVTASLSTMSLKGRKIWKKL